MAGLGAGMAPAQGSAENGPAELPPPGFSGTQYVDSRGCVFMRAGVDGRVAWVPRLSRDREALCGFRPTVAPEARNASIAPEARNAGIAPAARTTPAA
ncbi:MAG: SPOR domain-containing protein, partial [Rhodovulum sp.]